MNVRHLVPSVSRQLVSMGFLVVAAGLQQPVHASGADLSKFSRIEPQYIAALGDPGATQRQRRHGASGARTRVRAVASWTSTLN